MKTDKKTNTDKAQNNELTTANSALLAGAITLNFFWIFNLLKTIFPAVKSLFNIYDPVGPLLGLYIASVVIFIISFFALKRITSNNPKVAYGVYIVTAILFGLMVFPPLFESIAHAF